jgi:predicted negative regulator of RcsB-dependent stress response
MTTPNTDPTSSNKQPRAESFLDWFQINTRWIGVGAVAVLAAAFVAWYMPRAKALKNQNADKQLLAAKQSYTSGNMPLAEADLKKVADRYATTPAGTEAALLLAQLKLEKNDTQGAVTYLKALTAKLPDGPGAASARALLGDAYAQLEKPAEAAAAYEAAAGLTAMPNEKAYLLTKAGHAYMAADNRPSAQRIWEGLANQSENQSAATEARIRLGELSALAARS